LILLDGLELYDAFHLKDYQGFVSLIDSRTVGSVGFFADAFPAEYGGRMSGVIDIESIAPDDVPRTGVGLSTSNARLLTQGRFLDRRGQWLLSARRGFPGELLEEYPTAGSLDPVYWDVFAKTSFQLNPRTTLALHVLGSVDEVRGLTGESGSDEPFHSRHENSNVWLSLSDSWRPNLFSRTTISFSGLWQDRAGRENGASVDDRRTTDIVGLKQNWALDKKRHLVKWGIDLKRLRASYDYVSSVPDPADPSMTFERRIEQRPRGTDSAVFLADRIRAHEKLDLELGLRWSRQSYGGVEDSDVSPRINLIVRPGSQTLLGLGWGIFRQQQRINEMQVEDGIETFFGASRAEHQSLRLEQGLGRNAALRASIYRKLITDFRPRFENLFNPLTLFPEAAADRVRIAPARAELKGVELSVLWRMAGRMEWRAGYSLSRAEDEVRGSDVLRAWDQRHSLDLGFQYDIGPFRLGLAASAGSGRPTTPLMVESRALPDGSVELVAMPGPRNIARLPPYSRLDLRFTRTITTHRTMGELFIDVVNVLDRSNVCCVEGFNLHPLKDGTVRTLPREFGVQPRKINVGLNWTFGRVE